MELPGFLKAAEASAFAAMIRDSTWWFPLLEAVHVIGLALVLGTIVIVDLRLLNLASTNRPFERIASDILKWVWGAFALTVLTGSLMFITNAAVYFDNFYFRAKMLLLILAGVNMGVFEVTARKSVKEWDQSGSVPASGRAVGAFSLALWICVIIAGRMIGFTTSRASVAPPPEEVNLEDLFAPTPDAPPDPPK